MEKWQRLKFMPGTGLYEDCRRVTGSRKHIELSRSAAREGMVLLKNENHLLPFTEGTCLAVFGKGQADHVKGGGGSGDVYVAYDRSLLDGLEMKEAESKISLFKPLGDYYRAYVKAAYEEQLVTLKKGRTFPGLIAEPELPDALLKEAREFTDTAVITISRYSKEDIDRTGEAYDGDFYLSHEEEIMVEKVLNTFPKAVVVLNTGGVMDTSWFKDDDGVGAALLMWQAGMEGGLAAADLLLGDATPSGHLPDTFAKDFASYPFADRFNESDEYLEYREDIYVGYRYFETIPGAAEKVAYPFGYGLSYTSFAYSDPLLSEENGTFTASLTVKNTGDFAGRAVVQFYACAPQGKLGKPRYVLVGFAKTKLILPEREEQVAIRFSRYNFASFDDLGKIEKSAYVLEEGNYRFFFGEHVRALTPFEMDYTLTENVVLDRLSARCTPHRLPERLLSDGTMEALPVDETVIQTPYEPEKLPKPWIVPEESRWPAVTKGYLPKDYPFPPQFIDVAAGKMTLDDFVSQLDIEQKISLCGGQPSRGPGNTFGFGNLPVYGVPNVQTADGPAGLRLRPETGVNTTAFPSATLLASTWDINVCYEVGKAIAEEVKENGFGIWLAPAVNIHRSPLCGRNFEYFSEDPLIAGILSSAIVQGAQSLGIAVSLKHFACNNKEKNRHDSDSRVSERALREIYIKAFEICVKTAHPLTIMTSYNLVNEVRATENEDLITGILRGEWNFDGITCSDWRTHGIQYKEIAAGNDIKMPFGSPDLTYQAYLCGKISEEKITAAARRVLAMILKLE